MDRPGAQLKRGDEIVRLEPKVMGVLNHLAAHAGEVVSRDDLLDAVWPDVIVTENVLSRCVSELRRALGDDPRNPTLIETIPKAGYRLLLPIEPMAPPILARPHSGDGVPVLADIAPLPRLAPEPVPGRQVSWRWLAGGVVFIAILGLIAWLGGRSTPATLVASTPRPVTAQEGSEGLATLSPAGDRVAYVRFEEGGRSGAIEIVGTAGGTPLDLTAGPNDTYPTFSPDGQQIAFLRCEGERCRPYQVSALGTDERPMADIAVYPAGLAWSPDGRSLVYVEREESMTPLRLVLLNLESGATRPLTEPSATYLGDLFPAFAPDGQSVAFVRRTDRVSGDLFVVPTEGGEPRQLSWDQSQIARLSWFPDGRTVLGASDRDGTFRLWQFSTEGEPPAPLPLEAAMPIGPTLSADGSRLVVEAWDLPIQLWTYDLAAPDSTRRPLAASTRWDRMPAFSPGGDHAVFVSTRTGHAELWTATLDGSDPRSITSLAGPSVRTPQWSPDGSQIAFLARMEGRYDVFTVPVDGGTPQRLTSSEADIHHLRWSPDGQALYASRRLEDRWEAVRVPFGDGELAVLARDVTASSPSHDGRTLWLVKASTPGLWRLPLGADGLPPDGVEPTLAIPDLAIDDAPSWAVTPEGIVYLRRTGDDARLVRWTERGASVLIGRPLALDLWAPALAVSPDGSTLVLAEMGLPGTDILVTDLERH